MITQELLKELFDYREDGNFVRKKTGTVPSKENPTQGYKVVDVKRTNQRLHRMIFLYHHGYLPEIVDHIDGNTLNNKIENLRGADYQTNQFNRKKPKNKSNPCKNVNMNHIGKWIVQLKVNKKNKYFGCFDDLELADLVAHEARNLYYGAFARHS